MHGLMMEISICRYRHSLICESNEIWQNFKCPLLWLNLRAGCGGPALFLCESLTWGIGLPSIGDSLILTHLSAFSVVCGRNCRVVCWHGTLSLILLELIRCHLLVVHSQSLVIHVRAVRTFLSGFRFSATSSVGGVTHSAPGGRDIDTIPVFIAVTDDEETMG